MKNVNINTLENVRNRPHCSMAKCWKPSLH